MPGGESYQGRRIVNLSLFLLYQADASTSSVPRILTQLTIGSSAGPSNACQASADDRIFGGTSLPRRPEGSSGRPLPVSTVVSVAQSDDLEGERTSDREVDGKVKEALSLETEKNGNSTDCVGADTATQETPHELDRLLSACDPVGSLACLPNPMAQSHRQECICLCRLGASGPTCRLWATGFPAGGRGRIVFQITRKSLLRASPLSVDLEFLAAPSQFEPNQPNGLAVLLLYVRFPLTTGGPVDEASTSKEEGLEPEPVLDVLVYRSPSGELTVLLGATRGTKSAVQASRPHRFLLATRRFSGIGILRPSIWYRLLVDISPPNEFAVNNTADGQVNVSLSLACQIETDNFKNCPPRGGPLAVDAVPECKQRIRLLWPPKRSEEQADHTMQKQAVCQSQELQVDLISTSGWPVSKLPDGLRRRTPPRRAEFARSDLGFPEVHIGGLQPEQMAEMKKLLVEANIEERLTWLNGSL
ncbi:unnamed protein product [Protopolystoma xenopodis]|uniref:Uncharacterized protein n=1 Tax=Protopolystoma xenopodis TaxID=117903 RepID=A0A3S5BSY0_9PLAT|nr:unnamed protein product [Protopolystoma xenopodis]